jgi:peptidoglycan-N-acetylglucosamine deacetylase
VEKSNRRRAGAGVLKKCGDGGFAVAAFHRYFSITSFTITSMVGAVAGAAGMAAAVAAGYQTMSPRGQWYGRTFTGLANGNRKLALTYDDGPNDACTLRLLEVLAKYNVRATFFMIGRFAQQRPDLVEAVFRAGHAIGNHTFNHPNLILASAERTRRELTECQRVLRDASGSEVELFRPPWGARRPGTLQIARRLGLKPVMWKVTGYDWNAPPADTIVAKVSRQIRGGDVILLHDGGHVRMGTDRSQTVMASGQIVEKYRGEGFEFVTIPEMLAAVRTAIPAAR